MKNLFPILLCCSILACNNTEKPAPASDRHEFFPVSSFLQGQVHKVDSFKLPIRRFIKSDNSTDSSLIGQEEFSALAAEFTRHDINDPAIKQYYKETSFADQSIPSVTFNYVSTNKDLPLQRLDVIVKPDPVLNDQVTSVYIEKVLQQGDSSILKKMYWKSDRYFQVISSTELKGRPPRFSELKVTWSPD